MDFLFEVAGLVERLTRVLSTHAAQHCIVHATECGLDDSHMFFAWSVPIGKVSRVRIGQTIHGK